ncbi:conserved hypothetical protein [Ricinus communis]|uniref:Uncharacterized protein n=1 Tax=Ricinus communis TaxID=3988 RepID=B9T8V4_RICCO|nr:conserved hypothetical protein [Ricinus communis]
MPHRRGLSRPSGRKKLWPAPALPVASRLRKLQLTICWQTWASNGAAGAADFMSFNAARQITERADPVNNNAHALRAKDNLRPLSRPHASQEHQNNLESAFEHAFYSALHALETSIGTDQL